MIGDDRASDMRRGSLGGGYEKELWIAVVLL
jgi:hypothetical protein